MWKQKLSDAELCTSAILNILQMSLWEVSKMLYSKRWVMKMALYPVGYSDLHVNGEG